MNKPTVRLCGCIVLVVCLTVAVAAPQRQAHEPEPINPAMVQSLIETLGSPYPSKRADAATKLGTDRAFHPTVVQALITTLGDVDQSVRKAAVRALTAIGPDAKEAVPALIELGRVDKGTRDEVINALGVMAVESKKALDTLIDTVRGAKSARTRPLNYGDWRTREEACRVLGEVGPEAKAAVPVLLDILEYAAKDCNRQSHVYCVVATSLGKIGDQRAVYKLSQHRKGKGIHGTYERSLTRVIVAADTTLRSLELAKKKAEEEARMKADEEALHKAEGEAPAK